VKQEYYRTIVDRDVLEDFIENFLPDLEEGQKYFLSVFARKKYVDSTEHPDFTGNVGSKNGSSQIRSFASSKERIINRLEECQCVVGGFVTRKGLPIPPEAIAVYIHPNPRDVFKATLKSIGVFADIAVTQDKHFNPVSKLNSIIQSTSIAKKPFVIFDVDEKNEDTLTKINEIVDNRASILETRGGYHVIVRREDIKNHVEKHDRMWHNKLVKMSDQVGDIMIPVPGTHQGDFVPKFVQMKTLSL
jgi:hypothetical protein